MNQLWTEAKIGFLRGEIDWDTAVIKAALVRSYVFNSAHKFVSDLTASGGVLVATTTLTLKDTPSGAADAADPQFLSVPAGPAIPVAILFQASAVTGGADVPAGQQRLIAYFDDAFGLPFNPNNNTITWSIDNQINRLFRF